MEQPAKNYQVDALDQRLKAQERLSERVEEKLDQILINQTTPQQLEERLNNRDKEWEQKLTTIVREIRLEYGPTMKQFSSTKNAVIVAIIIQVGYTVLNIVRG